VATPNNSLERTRPQRAMIGTRIGQAAQLAAVMRPTIDRSAIIIMWTKTPPLELLPSMTQVRPALLVWA
jgi:hypothetical protein